MNSEQCTPQQFIWYVHEIKCLLFSLDAGFMWCALRIQHNICTVSMNGKGNWLTIIFVSIYLVCFVLSDRCTVFKIQVMVQKAHSIYRLILIKERTIRLTFFLSFTTKLVFHSKCWFQLIADFRLEMTYWLRDKLIWWDEELVAG